MFLATLVVHLLAVAIWVGGMLVGYIALHRFPGTIENPQRLSNWAEILKKAIPWVWMSIIALLLSGFYMIHLVGGLDAIETQVIIMLGASLVMIGVFKFMCAAPVKHLCRGVDEEKPAVAAFALGTVGKLIGFNLILGIMVITTTVILTDRI